MPIYEIRSNPQIFLDGLLPFLKLHREKILKFYSYPSLEYNISVEMVKNFLLEFNEPVNMCEFLELQISYMKYDLDRNICEDKDRTQVISNWVQEKALDFRRQFVEKQVEHLNLIDENLLTQIEIILTP